MKFEIEAIKLLFFGAFKGAWKPDRVTFHPHVLNIFIITIIFFWILALLALFKL
jgi:hypothetical protein